MKLISLPFVVVLGGRRHDGRNAGWCVYVGDMAPGGRL